MCSNNEHVLNNIENDVKKESQNTVEAGATVEGTRRALKHMNAKTKLEHAKPNLRKNKIFRQQPSKISMKECSE